MQYYNYLDLCDNDDYCEDDTYIHFNENNDIISETEDSSGFSFEYEFNLDNNKHRALIIQYIDFTGKKLKMRFTSYTQNETFLTIAIIVSSFFVFSTIVLIIVVVYQKRKLAAMIIQINKVSFKNNNLDEDELV